MMTSRDTRNEEGALAGAPFVPQLSPSNHTATGATAAQYVLKDAIIAAGVDPFAGVAILADADSFDKARVRDEFAAFRAELDNKEVA